VAVTALSVASDLSRYWRDNIDVVAPSEIER